MANTFKRVQATLTTALVDLYTCPAGKTALVFLGQAANIAAADVDVTIKVTDAANGNAAKNLAWSMTTPVGAILPFVGKGAVPLAANDKIQGLASANANADVIISVLEIG